MNGEIWRGDKPSKVFWVRVEKETDSSSFYGRERSCPSMWEAACSQNISPDHDERRWNVDTSS